MKKMNQVSVSEFFAKSKEELYDMAVELVEKYNRLVDICNDSAERMAEFMAKDDIDEFKKELQSKAPGEFKIQKLADIVVWADGWIEELEEDTGIEEFETVKKVVLESINRHTVYTSALNRDISEKAAKIELLEKEIEGRKAGYVALKEKMDTEYISIDEHNRIVSQFEEKVKHQRANLDGINKTLEMRNKEIKTLVTVKNNKIKEIEAHESENARLTERIMELKEGDDDHGRAGFKRYIEYLIEEEERAVPERFKERLNKEITEIFTKEEETEVKGVGRTSSGRYPWGAKVNDIPCGEDAIE